MAAAAAGRELLSLERSVAYVQHKERRSDPQGCCGLVVPCLGLCRPRRLSLAWHCLHCPACQRPDPPSGCLSPGRVGSSTCKGRVAALWADRLCMQAFALTSPERLARQQPPANRQRPNLPSATGPLRPPPSTPSESAQCQLWHPFPPNLIESAHRARNFVSGPTPTRFSARNGYTHGNTGRRSPHHVVSKPEWNAVPHAAKRVARKSRGIRWRWLVNHSPIITRDTYGTGSWSAVTFACLALLDPSLGVCVAGERGWGWCLAAISTSMRASLIIPDPQSVSFAFHYAFALSDPWSSHRKLPPRRLFWHHFAAL